MSDTVHCDIRHRVAILTLNRPEKLNALNYELIDRLIEAFKVTVRESFGLTEKPLNHEEVMKDYEVLKATIIPRIVALGIVPE